MTEKNTKELKQIGNYQIKFLKEYKKEVEDYIFFTITYSENLKTLLKGFVVDGSVTEIYQAGRQLYSDFETETLKLDRYKVRSVLFNSLYGDGRVFIFAKDLIDKGKIVLKFQTLVDMERFQEKIKESIKNALYQIEKLNNEEVVINYFVKNVE